MCKNNGLDKKEPLKQVERARLAPRRRIGIFTLYRGAEIYPALIHIIRACTNIGCPTDLFTLEIIPALHQQRVSFYAVSQNKGISPGEQKPVSGREALKTKIFAFLKGRPRNFLLRTYRIIKPFWADFCFFLKARPLLRDARLFLIQDRAYLDRIDTKIKSTEDYCCFIGIDAEGLILGHLSNHNRVPLIYCSMEIFYKTHPVFGGLRFRQIKKLEAEAHKNTAATIIQDEERRKLLYSDNGVSPDCSVPIFLPVSMPGGTFKEKTDYLHKTLRIPLKKRILLQIGSISPYRMSLEVAASARSFPNDCVVVMHGMPPIEVENDIEHLNVKGNIFLSKKLVPFNQIPVVVSSAHIGLVFYTRGNLNDYLIGAASSQLAHHLQCGIPVIVIDHPSLKRVVEEYGCGVAVKSTDEIPDAVREIDTDYSSYRANAFRCFEERYDFDKSFRGVCQFIESLRR